VLYCNRVSISDHFRDNGHFLYLVTTLTFLGHVTSSVTLPIDPPYVISYWCPIVTERLSLTVFEIFASKYIWVTTLTFLGHLTSSVTWPFDSPGAISYRWSIVTESLSKTIFEIMGNFYNKAQLTLTNPRDSKECKNCSNSTCFVSFHRIPFPQISNYQCIASRGIIRP